MLRLAAVCVLSVAVIACAPDGTGVFEPSLSAPSAMAPSAAPPPPVTGISVVILGQVSCALGNSWVVSEGLTYQYLQNPSLNMARLSFGAGSGAVVSPNAQITTSGGRTSGKGTLSFLASGARVFVNLETDVVSDVTKAPGAGQLVVQMWGQVTDASGQQCRRLGAVAFALP